MDQHPIKLGVIGKSPQYLERLFRALDHLNIPGKNILKFPAISCTLPSDLSIIFALLTDTQPAQETLDRIKHLIETNRHVILIHHKSIQLSQNLYDLGVKNSIFLDEINPYTVHRCLLYSKNKDTSSSTDVRLNLSKNPYYKGRWEFDLIRKEICWDEPMIQLFRIAPTSGRIPLKIWKSLVHPEDMRKLEVQLNKAVMPNGSFKSRFRMMVTASEVRHFQVEAQVICTKDHKPVKLVGEIHEITSEVRKREKLLVALTEKREILNSICTGFLAIERTRKITHWNKAAGNLTGIKKNSAIGNDVGEVLDLNSNRLFSEKSSSCFKNQKPVHFEQYEPRFKKWFDYTIRLKNNRLLVFFRDITSEKEKETELQALRRLQKDVINSSAGHIWAVDKDLNLILANHSFFQDMKKLTGFKYSIGKQVACQSTSALSETLKMKWRKAYKKVFLGQGLKMRIAATLLNGKQRHYQIVMNPIRSDVHDKEKVTGVACFSGDITSEVKHVKALKAKNRKLKEIAWIHSHLLRAPVTKIMGLVDIIQQSWDSKTELNDFLQFLKEASQELDELVKKIATESERSLKGEL